MNISPLLDRIVVSRKAEEQATAGGTILPCDSSEKPNQGEVGAVGSGPIIDNGSTQE